MDLHTLQQLVAAPVTVASFRANHDDVPPGVTQALALEPDPSIRRNGKILDKRQDRARAASGGTLDVTGQHAAYARRVIVICAIVFPPRPPFGRTSIVMGPSDRRCALLQAFQGRRPSGVPLISAPTPSPVVVV